MQDQVLSLGRIRLLVAQESDPSVDGRRVQVSVGVFVLDRLMIGESAIRCLVIVDIGAGKRFDGRPGIAFVGKGEIRLFGCGAPTLVTLPTNDGTDDFFDDLL